MSLLAAGPALLLGMLGNWLGGFISPDAAKYGQWAGWAIASSVYIRLLMLFVPFERKQCKLAQSDMHKQLVQNIHVTNPRIVEIAMVGNTGPNLAIDIGDAKILYLQGQWLYDCDIYGAEHREGDEGDEQFNRLPAPYSFPCSDFTISRFPNSGEVLRILVHGDYVQPADSVDALKPEHQFRPSEIFCGSIEEIEDVFDREYATRNPR